ncbi:hypothetical protein N7523_009763 [Penicillium sp. IBT 18751x]|nr:hypothetical protein N7523_009763 [Penicillium sp. IBT 18751x]
MARGRPKLQVAPCRFCKKQFKRLEHLQRHERIHTREKPFTCQCGRTFARRDLLSRHDRLCHLPDDAEGPTPLPTPSPHVQTQDEVSFASDSHETFSNSLSRDRPGPTALGDSLPPSYPGVSNVDASFEILNGQDTWNNDVFSFNNVIPSHFLDTDISLCDLFQQYPVQNQPVNHGDMTYTPDLGDFAQSHEFQFSVPAIPATTQDPPLPPRFPSADDQLHNTNLDARLGTVQCPWILSSTAYKRILEQIAQNSSCLPNFKTPSKFTLVRYLEGYFRGFHDHLPFIHLPTFDPATVELELLFALAAVGAVYRFEHAKGHELYNAARCLVDRNFSNHRQHTMKTMTTGLHSEPKRSFEAATIPHNRPQHESHGHGDSWFQEEGISDTCLRRTQAILILMAMSAWGEKALARDSLTMGSQLAVLVRELGISQSDDTTGLQMTWTSWVMHEQKRRTLLVAYILFNLQSITFNVPPLILNQEVALCLPSCEHVWRMDSSAAWDLYRQTSSAREIAFNVTLDRLLHGRSVSDYGAISSFSNYVLIHGLVQKIYLEHQAATCLPHSPSPMDSRLFKSLEIALRSWQSSWEATYESTLDPCSPKGPLGFNATALLRLAYIRLHTNTGLCHDLISVNPTQIGKLFSNYLPTRSPSMDRAILQCIHALSIPVRVGIAYVARTQSLHWNIQHSICSLECAFLLTRWMQTIARAVRIEGLGVLRADERKLLAMMTSLVRETHLDDSIEHEEDHSAHITRLAASTARLWAEVASGMHVFDLAHRIGTSLSVLADVLESQLPP